MQTYLDYLFFKKEQKEKETLEWINYKTQCQEHFEKNMENIKSFFSDKNSIWISFEDLEKSPFNEIPKFATLFPVEFSFVDYLDALGVLYELKISEVSFIPSNQSKEKNGFWVYTPF